MANDYGPKTEQTLTKEEQISRDLKKRALLREKREKASLSGPVAHATETPPPRPEPYLGGTMDEIVIRGGEGNVKMPEALAPQPQQEEPLAHKEPDFEYLQPPSSDEPLKVMAREHAENKRELANVRSPTGYSAMDYVAASATPLLMGLLMGNTGDAFEIAGKGILGMEKREYDEQVKDVAAQRKLAAASGKEGKLYEVIGPDGKPQYVTRENALGKAPYDKGTDFHLEDKMALEAFKNRLEGEVKDGTLNKDQFKQKLNLFKTWQASPLTKDTMKITSAWAKIKSAKNTPAGNMGMIFNFMRMLDPSSVVRESEFRTAGAAGELPEKIQYWYDMVINKKILGPTQRRDFISTAKGIYDQQSKQQANINNSLIGLAREAGLPNPESVVSGMAKGMGLNKSLELTSKQKKQMKRLEDIRKRKKELETRWEFGE